MNLRAALFDFDGLILDTEWPEVEAWTEVYRRHGFEFPDWVWQGAIGRGPEQEAVRAESLLSEWSAKPVVELDAEYQALRMRHILSQPVLPGVAELLAEAVASGVKVAAVSSSKRAWVEGHLQRLGLWEQFEGSYCQDDVARTKPFPDLYLLALAGLGVEPGEAVVFEDSPNGVAAGKAAGIKVVAVPNRLTAQLDLSAADLVVPSLAGIRLADL